MSQLVSRRNALRLMAQATFWAVGGAPLLMGDSMSQSNDEFLGRLDFIKRLRELETRMARLERHPGGEIPTVAVGEPTQGEAAALGGVPGLRHFNASHVNGFRAAADARPNALLPLDPNANIDLRRAGGEIFANRVTAGYGDSTAILDGVDATYRIWAGASAAASAPLRIMQTGYIEIGAGASVITMRSSPSPGAIVEFSSSGAMIIGINSACQHLGGVLWSQGNNRRWLAYYNDNAIAGCTNQLDFYSYNTNAAVLSLGHAGASSRVNTPWSVFDASGGSQIMDAAASGTTVGGHLKANKFISLPDSTTLTLSSGCVTATTSYHVIDTEGGAAACNCNTINGASPGRILILRSVADARDVTLKDAVDNLRLNGDFTLDDSDDVIGLLGHTTFWFEMFRSSNA